MDRHELKPNKTDSVEIQLPRVQSPQQFTEVLQKRHKLLIDPVHRELERELERLSALMEAMRAL